MTHFFSSRTSTTRQLRSAWRRDRDFRAGVVWSLAFGLLIGSFMPLGTVSTDSEMLSAASLKPALVVDGKHGPETEKARKAAPDLAAQYNMDESGTSTCIESDTGCLEKDNVRKFQAAYNDKQAATPATHAAAPAGAQSFDGNTYKSNSLTQNNSLTEYEDEDCSQTSTIEDERACIERNEEKAAPTDTAPKTEVAPTQQVSEEAKLLAVVQCALRKKDNLAADCSDIIATVQPQAAATAPAVATGARHASAPASPARTSTQEECKPLTPSANLPAHDTTKYFGVFSSGVDEAALKKDVDAISAEADAQSKLDKLQALHDAFEDKKPGWAANKNGRGQAWEITDKYEPAMAIIQPALATAKQASSCTANNGTLAPPPPQSTSTWRNPDAQSTNTSAIWTQRTIKVSNQVYTCEMKKDGEPTQSVRLEIQDACPNNDCSNVAAGICDAKVTLKNQ